MIQIKEEKERKKKENSDPWGFTVNKKKYDESLDYCYVLS